MMAMWYFTADLTSDTIKENIPYSKSQVGILYQIPPPLQMMGIIKTIRTLTFNKRCNSHPYFVKVHLENGRGFMNVTVIDPQTNQRTDDASVEAYIAQQLSLPVPGLAPYISFSKMVDEIQLSIASSWWERIIRNEFYKPYYVKLMKLLYVEYYKNNMEIYPLIQFNSFNLNYEFKIFAWTTHCTIDQVKVVIIGQDPYPTAGKANGLAFSDKTYVVDSIGSLTNIFTLLKADIGELLRKYSGENITLEHGDLTQWATQGVLLLNTALTVQEGKPYSHCEMGWEKLTSAVVKYIYERDDKSVFLLWGKVAQNLVLNIEVETNGVTGEVAKIPEMDNPRILTAPHPSEKNTKENLKLFFDCKHFSKANEYLNSKGVPLIDWNIY